MRVYVLVLWFLSLPVWADVYTYVDAQGNRVFTDDPKKGKRVDIGPTNSLDQRSPPALKKIRLSPDTPVPAIQAEAVEAPVSAPAYETLRILSPEPDMAIPSTEGKLLITLNSEPTLVTGHRYQVLLDGQPVSTPQESPVFELNNVDRGTHQLAAEIIDEQGNTLERTPSQPVHMKRINLALKRKVDPCKPGDWGVRPECPLASRPPEPRDIPWIPFL